MTGKFRQLCLGLSLCLIAALAIGGASEAVAGKGNTLLAFDVFELNLDIDTTLNINGDTRFFSSRHRRNVGGRFMGHSRGSEDKTLYFGHFLGLMWGRSNFLLNWEEPGLQSFPPLDSSITTIAIPYGIDLNWRIGSLLVLSPYVSAKAMLLHMQLEISNEDFSGNAFKLGLDAGLKVALNLGKHTIVAGAGMTHILNDEIEFEIEDLEFDSKTSGSSPEFFLGMEF